MPRAVEPVRAIGQLAADGTWVGFQSVGRGYRLVFGLPDGTVVADPTRGADRIREGLIAGAVAYFSEALTEAPPDLAATQSDLAALMRWVAAEAIAPSSARAAQEAMDAIDDGLAGDAVALRLSALSSESEADPLPLLRDRLRLASGSIST